MDLVLQSQGTDSTNYVASIVQNVFYLILPKTRSSKNSDLRTTRVWIAGGHLHAEFSNGKCFSTNWSAVGLIHGYGRNNLKYARPLYADFPLRWRSPLLTTPHQRVSCIIIPLLALRKYSPREFAQDHIPCEWQIQNSLPGCLTALPVYLQLSNTACRNLQDVTLLKIKQWTLSILTITSQAPYIPGCRTRGYKGWW